ncbi:MAG: gamma-butyrobetaine hydroxylase-like domain-containing protein [Pirellulaceae bacterium]
MTYPTALKLSDDNRLLITFSDNVTKSYRVRELRDACPCATCREKRSAPPADPFALPLLSKVELEPLRINGMKPVGNYAYTIAFSDGHDTGIFTFELLRELGTEAQS